MTTTQTRAGPAIPAADGAPGRRLRRLGWGLILAGVLLLAAWAAVTAVQTLGHARSLRGHLQALDRLARDAPQGQAEGVAGSASQHLAGVRADLEALQRRVGPLLPVGRLLGWIPVRGGDLAAAADLLQMATAASIAGDETVRGLLPAVEMVDNRPRGTGARPSLLEGILPALEAARPGLQVARGKLAQAEEARSRVDAATLSPQVAGLLARLDSALPWLETAVDGLLLAPSLLGADRPRTYLVLVQNNDELRAGGGFLSGVGEMAVEAGRLGAPRFIDSYAVDNFSVPHDLAPADLAQVLSGELWFFRDANWDPDFRRSAQRAVEIYGRDQGVHADGAVALDLDGLQLLLDGLGPLQVEGVAEPLTGQNLLQAIQAAWGDSSGGGADLAWWRHRKDFMGPFASAALARLLGGQDVDWVRLARAVKQALDEKHLLLYLPDVQAASLLRARNWDGALPEPSSAHDVLLVVDSNVGFNKVDASVERSIAYQVDLADPEGPLGRLTLTYRNHSPRTTDPCVREPHYGAAYGDLMAGCYWDYVRVVVPAGSRLLKGPALTASAGAEAPRDLPATLALGDWQVLTAFLELAPGEEQSLTFEYRLPPGALERDPGGQARYSLRVQKQPGTRAVGLHLEVRLPEGAVPISAYPVELGSTGGVSTDLRLDREFELTFQERRNP